MNNNIGKMIDDHNQMKGWHETMAKSAAAMMQDHIKAAAWHESQSNLIKGMMQEVPLDPEKKQTTIPSGSYTPTPSSGGGMNAPAKEVPMDPQAVKKADLVSLLKSHEDEHGRFDMAVEDIAAFLLAE